MAIPTSITAPTEPGLIADRDLNRSLLIAAHIGDISKDQVNVSYTSLLIGLFWNDDRTAAWLNAQQPLRGARLQDVYRQRNLTGAEKADIEAKIDIGAPFSSRPDQFSISARTVLRDARSIATESGL